ncbi:hypothetical protein ACVPOS_14645 [Staphylococcus aureus]
MTETKVKVAIPNNTCYFKTFEKLTTPVITAIKAPVNYGNPDVYSLTVAVNA